MLERYNIINAVLIAIAEISGVMLRISGHRRGNSKYKDNGMCLILIGFMLLGIVLTFNIVFRAIDNF